MSIRLYSDINNDIINVVRRFQSLFNNVNFSLKHAARPFVQTNFQTLFGFKFELPHEKVISDVIIEHAFMAERLGPGGFCECIDSITRALLDKDDGIFSRDKETLKTIVEAGANKPSLYDMQWLIDRYAVELNSVQRSMLFKAFELAGFGGKIFVERSQNHAIGVELVSGYTFNCSPGFSLTRKISAPRIACIDGFIESVAEIHALLEDASASKEPVLLFIRGAANDVLHTFKVNYDRGTLVVVPIIVKFDLEGINTLVDVCTATGTDLVSSAKGDLISSVKFHSLLKIDHALIFNDRVILANNSSSQQVVRHVSDLRRRRSEEQEDTLADLLDKRIRSLSPRHVVIRLSNDQEFVKTSQAFDYVLRSYTSMCRYGTVTIDGKKKLTATAVAAKVYTDRCVNVLRSLGATLT